VRAGPASVRERSPRRALPRAGRRLAYGLLGLLFLLHNDLWWWHDGRLVLGLPVGLAYHLAYCFAAAVVMALLVAWAWPRLPEDPEAAAGPPARPGSPAR
jgi:hypothetical protein